MWNGRVDETIDYCLFLACCMYGKQSRDTLPRQQSKRIVGEKGKSLEDLEGRITNEDESCN